MASTVSFPSHQFHNFSLPPPKDRAATTDHFSTENLFTSSQPDYSFLSTNNLVDRSTGSMESHHHHHLAAETSETKTTASDGRPKFLIKFRTRCNDLATARNDEEYCEKVETSEKIAPASEDDPVLNMEEQTLAVSKVETSKKRAPASEDDPVVNMEEPTLAVAKVDTSEKRSTPSNSGSQLKIKIKLDGKSKKKTKDHKTVVATDGNVEEKKTKKRAFSVSLTEEEIETDMIAAGLGGLKRSRKCKKRPKSVQKLLDNLFPGLGLKSITLGDYRVS